MSVVSSMIRICTDTPRFIIYFCYVMSSPNFLQRYTKLQEWSDTWNKKWPLSHLISAENERAILYCHVVGGTCFLDTLDFDNQCYEKRKGGLQLFASSFNNALFGFRNLRHISNNVQDLKLCAEKEIVKRKKKKMIIEMKRWKKEKKN